MELRLFTITNNYGFFLRRRMGTSTASKDIILLLQPIKFYLYFRISIALKLVLVLKFQKILLLLFKYQEKRLL